MKTNEPQVKSVLFENENGRIIPLDNIDLDIVKRMLKDAEVSDSTLSTKLNLSDTTIKDRRKTVEESFLTKNYLIDVSALGWRVGDLYIDVGKGKSKEIAERIFSMFPNMLEVSLRIDSTATVFARIFYRDLNELAAIKGQIEKLPFVKDVSFSEIITIVRARSIGTMKELFIPLEKDVRAETAA